MEGFKRLNNSKERKEKERAEDKIHNQCEHVEE